MSLFSAISQTKNQVIHPEKVTIEGEITKAFYAGKIESSFKHVNSPLEKYKILIQK